MFSVLLRDTGLQMHYSAHILCGVWGFKFISSHLNGKVFAHWAIFQVEYIFYLIVFPKLKNTFKKVAILLSSNFLF